MSLIRRFENTIHVLEELRHRGIKLAAVTTRSARTSIRSLETMEIVHFFDTVVSAEDVMHHKPHPEPLLKALDALNVKPKRAVMVGDTTADIGAGKNAGTLTVAALYGYGGERLLALQPDYAIRDIRELLEL